MQDRRRGIWLVLVPLLSIVVLIGVVLLTRSSRSRSGRDEQSFQHNPSKSDGKVNPSANPLDDPPPESSPLNSCSVSGFLLWKETRLPVSAGWVELNGKALGGNKRYRRSKTDQWGEFEITGLPQGSFFLVGSASLEGNSLATHRFTLGEGEKYKIELLLETVTDLKGVVLNTEGDPIPGAKVTLSNAFATNDQDQHLAKKRYDTDCNSNGEFRFPSIQVKGKRLDGKVGWINYFLIAKHPEFSDTYETYVLGTARDPVTIIMKRKPKKTRIHGRIISDQGFMSGADIRFRWYSKDTDGGYTSMVVSTSSDEDGNFEFEITNDIGGKGYLLVQASGLALERIEIDPAPGRDIDLANVHLSAGSRIRGVVVTTEGKAIPGVTIKIRPETEEPFQDWFEVIADDKGIFVCDWAGSGTYEVWATPKNSNSVQYEGVTYSQGGVKAGDLNLRFEFKVERFDDP